MSGKSTRREFLILSACGTAAATTAPAHAISAFKLASQPDSKPAHWEVWITDDYRRLEAGSPLPMNAVGQLIAQDVITVSPENRFQSILGFGGAFTDASCYLFSRVPDNSRAELFHTLFDPSEMGWNVCRTCIGSADSARTVYSYDDGDPDPELNRFSIEHDRDYILPILRQARNINRDLFLFSSPWSPPGWMKDNGSMLGGCMRHTYMPSYADYFVKFLASYEAEGVPIQAVTVQNEVDADQDGKMPACFWPQDYETDFVRFHLGPRFRQGGVKTKIWIIDHNYNLWGRAIAELEMPDVREFTNAVAWHGYTGEPESMSRVQAAFPDLEMYWTEGSPDYDDPEYSRCWAAWGQKFTAILRNSCRSITAWNLATDEHGRPNVGPYPCGGLLRIDSRTKKVDHSGQYWAMGHFSKFVRRGSVRIDSEGSASDLFHCAFETPEGSLVIVLTNPGPSRTCEIRFRETAAQLKLPANSVATLQAKASRDERF
jgi:glucosylceramidase